MKLLTLLVILQIVSNFVVPTDKKRSIVSAVSKEGVSFNYKIQIDGNDIVLPGKPKQKEEVAVLEKEKKNLLVGLADEKKRCNEMKVGYEKRIAELEETVSDYEKRISEYQKEKESQKSVIVNPVIVDFLGRCSKARIPTSNPNRTVAAIEDAVLSLRSSYMQLRKRIPEIERFSQLDLNIIGATSFVGQQLKQLQTSCDELVRIHRSRYY